MRRSVLTVMVFGLATGLSACSANVEFSIGGQPPEDAAVDLIEGELSDDLGLAMTGECDDVDDPEVGVSFECTGTTDDGRVVEFDATIDEEDHISVFSVNVVNAGAVGRFAAAEAGPRMLRSAVRADRRLARRLGCRLRRRSGRARRHDDDGVFGDRPRKR